MCCVALQTSSQPSPRGLSLPRVAAGTELSAASVRPSGAALPILRSRPPPARPLGQPWKQVNTLHILREKCQEFIQMDYKAGSLHRIYLICISLRTQRGPARGRGVRAAPARSPLGPTPTEVPTGQPGTGGGRAPPRPRGPPGRGPGGRGVGAEGAQPHGGAEIDGSRRSCPGRLSPSTKGSLRANSSSLQKAPQGHVPALVCTEGKLCTETPVGELRRGQSPPAPSGAQRQAVGRWDSSGARRAGCGPQRRPLPHRASRPSPRAAVNVTDPGRRWAALPHSRARASLSTRGDRLRVLGAEPRCRPRCWGESPPTSAGLLRRSPTARPGPARLCPDPHGTERTGSAKAGRGAASPGTRRDGTGPERPRLGVSSFPLPAWFTTPAMNNPPLRSP